MLSSKIRSIVWYSKRPTLWRQLVRSAVAHLNPEPDTSADALAWCEKNGITTTAALEKILKKKISGRAEDLHSADFARAHALESACPEVMGGPGDLDLLYYLVKESGATRVVETGVAYGWSSLVILLAMQGRPGARLVSTDMPYVQGANDKYVGCVVERPEMRRQWTLLRGPDRDLLPGALESLGEIDLCHYDSDKSARGRHWAYPLLWSFLRPEGIFISDDIHDNVAFRDFAASLGLEPTVVKVSDKRHTKFVGVIQKPA